jgi:2-dehydro-3-deoxyphosphogluconate aldolase/(4S)-4-hydroxy-2-oxoglutarate aldolase
MIETGLVPIFYHPSIDIAKKIVSACVEGGVRCIEFTNRGDQAHLVFQELVRNYQSDDRVIFGAGSIIDPGTASLYIQSGANFIVSPIFDPEVARVCNRRKIPYCPGCGTVNEISRAEEAGVEIVKIFPGSQVGGPPFVKAVRGPMPWTRIMPTGGVSPTEENIRVWFEAGVACVGMGSKLISKDLIEVEDFESITGTVNQVLNWIRAVRGNTAVF